MSPSSTLTIRWIDAEYSPAEAAEITGVSATLQRDWRRRGIISPRSGGQAHMRFTFPDLCRIYALKSFSDAGVALKAVNQGDEAAGQSNRSLTLEDLHNANTAAQMCLLPMLHYAEQSVPRIGPTHLPMVGTTDPAHRIGRYVVATPRIFRIDDLAALEDIQNTSPEGAVLIVFDCKTASEHLIRAARRFREIRHSSPHTPSHGASKETHSMTMQQAADDRRTKATQFLWITQTALLRLAADVLKADETQGFTQAHRYSGSGTFIVMDEAVRAAGLIPTDMDPGTAAKEFCDFWENENRERRVQWFTRFGNERTDYSILSKSEQFLWIVQSVILADAANQSARDPAGSKGEVYNHRSVMDAMREAVRASMLIPDDLDVTEAANDFTSFSIPGMRERNKAPKWYRK